ncbi:MAG: SDR family NAD(P)-dependent oxidoreductase [Brachybacterium tyrofermentans]
MSSTSRCPPGRLTRAFAPLLAAKQGNTAIINLHSALSWCAVAGIYSATKAALWSSTNSLRLELQPAGVQVVGMHVGWVDTAMAAHATDDKVDPAVLVAAVFDATEAGEHEVLADETSVQAKAGLSAPFEAVYPQLAGWHRSRKGGEFGAREVPPTFPPVEMSGAQVH